MLGFLCQVAQSRTTPFAEGRLLFSRLLRPTRTPTKGRLGSRKHTGRAREIPASPVLNLFVILHRAYTQNESTSPLTPPPRLRRFQSNWRHLRLGAQRTLGMSFKRDVQYTLTHTHTYCDWLVTTGNGTSRPQHNKQTKTGKRGTVSRKTRPFAAIVAAGLPFAGSW